MSDIFAEFAFALISDLSCRLSHRILVVSLNGPVDTFTAHVDI